MPNTHIGFQKILQSSGHWKIKIIKLVDYWAGSLIAFLVPARRAERSISSEELKRVLVIRPGGIGDAVLLLPILRAIKNKFPHLGIDILCERRNQGAFISQKNVYDQLYCYDDLKSFMAARGNSYDAVIDTEQWHYLSALVAYFYRPKYLAGFASRPLRAKLFNFKIDYDLNLPESRNFQKLFTALLPSLGTENPLEGTFEISPELSRWAQEKVPARTVSLYLGGSLPEKRLSQQQINTIVRFIIDTGHIPLILGGKDVLQESLQTEKDFQETNLVNWTGKTTLPESAAIIQKSRLFIGTDSGLMHLACAVGTPVIAIFSSSNVKKWGPQGTRHTIITENVRCSPCAAYSYSIPTCQGKFDCVKGLQLETIKTKLRQMPL